MRRNKWCILHCLCICGDVPAVSTLTGFKEGLGFAKRPYRLCHIDKIEMKQKHQYSILDLRTDASFFMDINRLRQDPNLSKQSGINEETPMNNLRCFSLFKSVAFDVKHTLNERIIPKMTTAL